MPPGGITETPSDVVGGGQFMKRFNEEISKMSEDSGLEPWEQVSAAIGAAFYDETVDDGIDSLFKRADHIMYTRKKEMKAARE